MSAVENVAVRYQLAHEEFTLDVDFELPLLGVIGIFGRSGAGKTTLLRCIAGLEQPESGQLVVAGETWQDGETFRPVHERDIGYVFQEPRLFPHLDVRANLEYGQRRKRRDGIALHEAVELLGLGDMLTRSVASLSGGEAQRVAIARALLRGPRFVLMDEPLTGLDRARREEVLPFLDRLHLERKIPIVYVSHDIDEIARLCDSLVIMDGGQSVASGELQDVLLRTDIPLLGGAEAGAVIHGQVEDYDAAYDLARVSCSGGPFFVPGRHETGARLRLRVRASDISICREKPSGTTILNVLPSTIESIEPESTTSNLVTLKLGDDRVIARITKRSTSELGLQPGDDVFAQIKSVAVRNTSIVR